MERTERCIVCMAIAALIFVIVHGTAHAFDFGWGETTRPNTPSAWEYAPGEGLRPGRVFEGVVLATREVRMS